MGGHADGELAAQAVTDTLLERYEAGGAGDEPVAFLEASISAAHRNVHALGQDMDLVVRPRTTCTAAVVRDDSVWWAHVGDSRLYLFRGGEVVLRTRDHSHVETLLRIGEITAEEAVGHPLLNWVERSIGGERDTPEIEFGGPERIAAGDTVLLCTDGFWEPLDPAAVGEYLAGPESLDAILADLVEQAVEAAAPNADNTTVAALRVL